MSAGYLRSLVLSGALLLSGLACRTPPSWDTLKPQIREEFPAVEHIAIADLEQRLGNSAAGEMLLVDVRRPEEFAVSHLRGAVNLEDPDAIMALAEQQGTDQIVLYCSVGYRSARMAQALETKDGLSIVNLEGSIFEWANSGRPVFVGQEAVTRVHPFDRRWGQLLDRRYHSH